MVTLYHMMAVYLYPSNWVGVHIGVKVADLLIKDLVRNLMHIRLLVKEGTAMCVFWLG